MKLLRRVNDGNFNSISYLLYQRFINDPSSDKGKTQSKVREAERAFKCRQQRQALAIRRFASNKGITDLNEACALWCESGEAKRWNENELRTGHREPDY